MVSRWQPVGLSVPYQLGTKDRALFWRESASGVGVSAFFLSRVPPLEIPSQKPWQSQFWVNLPTELMHFCAFLGQKKTPRESRFQVMVYLFDVLVWCYAYTALWMVFSEAPCSYWMWLIAFRMTAAPWAMVEMGGNEVVMCHTSRDGDGWMDSLNDETLWGLSLPWNISGLKYVA